MRSIQIVIVKCNVTCTKKTVAALTGYPVDPSKWIIDRA